MSNLYAPFRYDYVGSFLRPAELKKARADYEAGAITADQLKAVEDQCITNWWRSRKRPDTMLLLTASSAALPGIWILCGDSTASAIRKRTPAFPSTERRR